VSDARFEDADEGPLRLLARDGEDLAALSALVQDAVFPGNEMQWDRVRRRFAVLLNRVRRENPARNVQRVQSVLVIEDVLKASSQGVERDADTVLSLLALAWLPGEDGMGRLEMTFAGDGALALDVECLEVTLRDVTRPYHAPSGRMPDHDT